MSVQVDSDALGTGLAKVAWVALLIAPILDMHAGLHALPRLLQGGLAVSCGAFFIAKMIRFPRWNDELANIKKFLRAIAALLAVVVVENFCTWVTSAWDQHKFEYQPLQDNVEVATLWLFQRLPLLRTLVMGWRVDMHYLLYCLLALCLSVIWAQVPYSGFGIGARFMDTIAWTHSLRTLAFMVTVLPNPRPHCYRRNFPPVPATAAEFISIGFSAKRGSGCNDLVISGHGVVYAAVPLALQTFYPLPLHRGGPAALAWAAVAKLCLQEVVDKTHYSVDMLLAVAVTVLVWHWRQHVHPATQTVRRRKAGGPPDPLAKGLVAVVVGVFVLVLGGVAGV